MTTYDIEQASEELEAASLVLTGWLHVLGDEYVSGEQPIQRCQLEDSAYIDAAQMFKGLIEGLQPEHTLRLEVGTMAVQAARFGQTPYDNRGMRLRELAPGSVLGLKRATLVSYMFDEVREELFVGFGDRLALSEVAKTLTRGGDLSIVKNSLSGLNPILRTH